MEMESSSFSSISVVESSRRSVIIIVLLFFFFFGLRQLFGFESDLVSIATEIGLRALSSSFWRLCIANFIIFSLFVADQRSPKLSEAVNQNAEKTTDHTRSDDSSEEQEIGFKVEAHNLVDEQRPNREELQVEGENREEEEEEEEEVEEFHRKIEEYIAKIKLQMKMEIS